MKVFGTLVVVLGLLLPASARAQSVKMADLAGTWVITSRTSWDDKGVLDAHDTLIKGNNDTLVIRPDTTFRWPNDKFFPLYRFTGDSLMLTPYGRYKVTLKDQQLTLQGTSIPPARILKTKLVAQRVDASKPTP